MRSVVACAALAVMLTSGQWPAPISQRLRFLSRFPTACDRRINGSLDRNGLSYTDGRFGRNRLNDTRRSLDRDRLNNRFPGDRCLLSDGFFGRFRGALRLILFVILISQRRSLPREHLLSAAQQ